MRPVAKISAISAKRSEEDIVEIGIILRTSINFECKMILESEIASEIWC
jgi:hypothetical protein